MAPRNNLVLAIIWNSQYLGARDNYVRAKIWCGGKSKRTWTGKNQNQGTSPWHFCCIFISQFYRAYKYIFFPLQFSYQHSETSPSFCFHDLLYFQNNDCKKKTRNSRGKSRAVKTHLYPIYFFFSFTSFSL